MYNNLKITFSLLVLLLCALCSFFVTKYTNQIAFDALAIDDIPRIYSLFSSISSTITALIPLVVFFFFYCTTDIMMNTLFEENISKKNLFFIIGLALVPLLVYQYFLWYNLITYCNANVIKTINDYYNIKFIFNLSFSNINLIGKICWVLFYLSMIALLYFKKVKLYKILISVISPSLLVVIIYNILVTY
jgi:hypothetical protein